MVFWGTNHCQVEAGVGLVPVHPSPAPPIPPQPGLQQPLSAWAAPRESPGYFSCPSSPVAAVSPVLDCGYCLIGGMKITRFICKNVGFSVGKFCIMPKKSWPPPSFRVSVHSTSWKKSKSIECSNPREGLARVPLGLETQWTEL